MELAAACIITQPGGLSSTPPITLRCSPHAFDLTDFLLRRAATRPTITYRQLVGGAQINGALPALTSNRIGRMEKLALAALQVDAQYQDLDRGYNVVRKYYEELISRRESSKITAAYRLF